MIASARGVANFISATRRHELASHHVARSMFRFAKVQALSRLTGQANRTHPAWAAGVTVALRSVSLAVLACAVQAA